MTIKIYGITYNIKIVESNSRIDDTMGRVDSKTGEITLSKEMLPEIKFKTLIHEIIETINEENELGLKHPQIQSIAVGFTNVLLENNIYNYLGVK